MSRRAVDAALDGVAYDPAVKRHDGGAAMFGHNFAGFAASHVTPGMVSRGRAELKRYAAPLATIEQRFGVPGPVLVAIWGQETSFGGDIGSFPTYSALRPSLGTADARNGTEPSLSMRSCWLTAASWRSRIAPWRLGGRDRPDPAHAVRLSHVRHDSGRHRDPRPHPQFGRRARFHRCFPQGARLAAGAGWDEGEPNFAAILQWNSAEIYAKTVALFADRLAGR